MVLPSSAPSPIKTSEHALNTEIPDPSAWTPNSSHGDEHKNTSSPLPVRTELREGTTELVELFSKHKAEWQAYKRTHGSRTSQDWVIQQREISSGSRSHHSYVGLYNQGATCYMNSVLQSLFMTPEFRSKLFEWKCEKGDEHSMIGELQTLFSRLQLSNATAVTTLELTKAFGWGDRQAYEQQDAHEFFRVLFSALEEEGPCGKDIIDVFDGQVEDYVQCLKCNSRKARKEHFQDVSINAQNVESVQKAIAEYIKPERLEGDNQYDCETCGHKSDALKGISFVSLPQVWLLHLKRFVFDWDQMERYKLQDQVKIPLQFDAKSYISPNTSRELNCEGESVMYSLGAVVVHVGTAKFGHYFAVVRDPNSDEWVEFNDADTSVMDRDDVLRYFGSDVVERFENDSNSNCVAENTPEILIPGTVPGTLSSGGGYMLLYRRLDTETTEVSSLCVPTRCEIEIQEENQQLQLMGKIESISKHLLEVQVFTCISDPLDDGNDSPELLRHSRIVVHDHDSIELVMKRCAEELEIPIAPKTTNSSDEPAHLGTEQVYPAGLFAFDTETKVLRYNSDGTPIQFLHPHGFFRLARSRQHIPALYFNPYSGSVPKSITSNQIEQDKNVNMMHIKFNDPNVTPIQFDFTVRVDRGKSVGEVKELLLRRLVLLRSSSNIQTTRLKDLHLKLSAQSRPIRDESQSLQDLNLNKESVLVLGLGAPIPVGKLHVKVFLATRTEDVCGMSWSASRKLKRYKEEKPILNQVYDESQLVDALREDVMVYLTEKSIEHSTQEVILRVIPSKPPTLTSILPVGHVLREGNPLGVAIGRKALIAGKVRITVQVARGAIPLPRDRCVTMHLLENMGNQIGVKKSWIQPVQPRTCTWMNLWNNFSNKVNENAETESHETIKFESTTRNFVLAKVSSVTLSRLCWWQYDQFSQDRIVGQYPLTLTDTSELVLCTLDIYETLVGNGTATLEKTNPAACSSPKQNRSVFGETGITLKSRSKTAGRVQQAVDTLAPNKKTSTELSLVNHEHSENGAEHVAIKVAKREPNSQHNKQDLEPNTTLLTTIYDKQSSSQPTELCSETLLSTESENEQPISNKSHNVEPENGDKQLSNLQVNENRFGGTGGTPSAKERMDVEGPCAEETPEQTICLGSELNKISVNELARVAPSGPKLAAIGCANQNFVTNVSEGRQQTMTEKVIEDLVQHDCATKQSTEMNYIEPAISKMKELNHESGYKNNPSVPALNLEDILNGDKQQGYHEEFMATSHLWSQSWREAANSDPTQTPVDAAISPRLVSCDASPTPIKERCDKDCQVDGETWKVGDKVLAKSESWSRFYPAQVKRKNKDQGTFQVLFDDGEFIPDLPATMIRKPLTRPPRRNRIKEAFIKVNTKKSLRRERTLTSHAKTEQIRTVQTRSDQRFGSSTAIQQVTPINSTSDAVNEVPSIVYAPDQGTPVETSLTHDGDEFEAIQGRSTISSSNVIQNQPVVTDRQGGSPPNSIKQRHRKKDSSLHQRQKILVRDSPFATKLSKRQNFVNSNYLRNLRDVVPRTNSYNGTRGSQRIRENLIPVKPPSHQVRRLRNRPKLVDHVNSKHKEKRSDRYGCPIENVRTRARASSMPGRLRSHKQQLEGSSSRSKQTLSSRATFSQSTSALPVKAGSIAREVQQARSDAANLEKRAMLNSRQTKYQDGQRMQRNHQVHCFSSTATSKSIPHNIKRKKVVNENDSAWNSVATNTGHKGAPKEARIHRGILAPLPPVCA